MQLGNVDRGLSKSSAGPNLEYLATYHVGRGSPRQTGVARPTVHGGVFLCYS